MGNLRCRSTSLIHLNHAWFSCLVNLLNHPLRTRRPLQSNANDRRVLRVGATGQGFNVVVAAVKTDTIPANSAARSIFQQNRNDSTHSNYTSPFLPEPHVSFIGKPAGHMQSGRRGLPEGSNVNISRTQFCLQWPAAFLSHGLQVFPSA